MLQTSEPLDVVDLVKGFYNDRPYFQVFVRMNPRDAALKLKCEEHVAQQLEAETGNVFHGPKDLTATINPFKMTALIGIEQANRTEVGSDRVQTAVGLRILKAKVGEPAPRKAS
jgi:hypothetical protein